VPRDEIGGGGPWVEEITSETVALGAAALGDASIKEMLDAGRALPLDDAVELARVELAERAHAH
jgi:hypothetical protein